MTRPAPAVEGLRRHAQQRSETARAAIEEALRYLRRNHQAVNVNAVARRAGVDRKTVYNHTDLLERIKNHRQQPRSVAPEAAPTGHNPIISALRNELATQKTRYETEISRLRAQLRQREDQLAVAHGELQRQLIRHQQRSVQAPAEPTSAVDDTESD